MELKKRVNRIAVQSRKTKRKTTGGTSKLTKSWRETKEAGKSMRQTSVSLEPEGLRRTKRKRAKTRVGLKKREISFGAGD